MEIVTAQSCHIPEIEAIERECFADPWPVEALSSYLTGNHIMLAAIEDGCVAGYVGLMYVLDEGYIANVAVSGRCRRRGYARALLEALEAFAREKELAFLTLEVRAANDPAIALYSSCGYREVGRRKNYYTHPTEDAILMTLQF